MTFRGPVSKPIALFARREVNDFVTDWQYSCPTSISSDTTSTAFACSTPIESSFMANADQTLTANADHALMASADHAGLHLHSLCTCYRQAPDLCKWSSTHVIACKMTRKPKHDQPASRPTWLKTLRCLPRTLAFGS
jgi:hypothetical protein